ncbi:MAG: hypothetical protein ACT4PE_08335 [Candidatus Eiseniibacteriota bacterium]
MRLLLIHWNRAEGEERLARLRASGQDADLHWDPEDGPGLRRWVKKPPEAIVIDLGRIPSHGRACGVSFRQHRATRGVPLVFVGGDKQKVAATRALLPDATYTSWSRIRSALRAAARMQPEKPAVPGTMQGYSGTPLPKKLGIKPGTTVALLGAPVGFERALAPLPDGVRTIRQARGRADRVLLFVKTRAELAKRFATATRTLDEKGGLWIVWPKKASGLAKDLDEAVVRRYGMDRGFVDYKIAAVDATWSGLQFARRAKR